MDLLQNLFFGFQASKRLFDTTLIASKNTLEYSLLSLLGRGDLGPKQLRKTFEELGGTYIKLGQLIASAPSLFPREYVDEFQKCLDQVSPMPYDTVRYVLQQELKDSVHSYFRHIDKEPIASASIAQVHGAELHNGAQVVIKVLRPEIEDKLNVDMNFLNLAAHILEALNPEFHRTSLTGIVEDFHKVMLEEIDFIKEGKNIDQFREFLTEQQEKEAVVPWVYWDSTTTRVLTMERLYGVPLTDLESLRQISKHPEKTLLTALNVWYKSLAMCDFFHADVHAGNLLVLNDGRVAFIDFGIVGRIPEKVWMGLLLLMQAMTTLDYRLMAKAMVQTGATAENIDTDYLAQDLEKIFTTLNPQNPEKILSLSEMELNGLVMDIAETGERHGIRFPRAFALLMKQMLYFDRYVHILAPDMDILRDQRINMPELRLDQ